MYSHADEATLFGGWGGHEQGWPELRQRYEWASARFDGGEVAFDEVAQGVSGALAYTVWFERSRVRLAGQHELAPMVLRVTQVYRHETDGWKLMRRHADAIATVQAPQSVLER